MHERELNAFILARTLMRRADELRDGTPPGAVGAVVLYDLAIETAAKAVEAEHIPTTFPGTGYVTASGELARGARPRELTLPRVLDHLLASARRRAADESLSPTALREGLRLHELRNHVQHAGDIPSEADIARSRLRAFDLLEWLAQTFHGRPLESLSRASLVASTDVRVRLEAAEEHGANRRFDQGAVELAIAFAIARGEFRSDEPYRRTARLGDVRGATDQLNSAIETVSRAAKASMWSHSRPTRRLEDLLRAMIRQIELLDDRVEALLLGAAASEYHWFTRRIPEQYQTLDGKWHAHEPDPPLTAAEFGRALDFVTTTALHWQQFPAPPAPLPEDEEPVAEVRE